MVKTVGQLRELIEDLEDDYTIEFRVRREIKSDKLLRNLLYPYPYETIYTEIEFDDIGVSDKQLCLGCDIDLDDFTLYKQEVNNESGIS